MKHRITILTLSRKWGGRCVVGYDHNDERLVRLVSDSHGKELELYRVRRLHLLDIVEAEIERICPVEHQTENILIAPGSRLTVIGKAKGIAEFNFLVNKNKLIFGDTRYKIHNVSNLRHSIEVVRFTNMLIHIEDNKSKANFLVDGAKHEWYRITDIIHENRTHSISSGYAIISLPPSDDYAKENGYFKYVSAIYPIE